MSIGLKHLGTLIEGVGEKSSVGRELVTKDGPEKEASLCSTVRAQAG